MTAPIGVLVLAYGTASGPEDIERYYTDIRGGRAPSPEHLADLRARYEAIGNVFPLLDTTRVQAEGLVARLSEDGTPSRAFLGMKHSPPFIPDAVAQMREEGVERGVGIVMAPHWSGMSVETYIERVRAAVADQGGRPVFSFVREYGAHPSFVRFLAARVADALEDVPPAERSSAQVLFTAHSLPTRVVEDGSLRCKTCTCDGSCRYRAGLQETADLVAGALGLESYGRAPVGPPIRGGVRRWRSRSSKRRRWAIPRWSCARPASWPTISRPCTTSTSRRRRSPRGRASGSHAPRCRTATQHSWTSWRTSCETTW